jgi:hypothetical protein
LITDLSIVDDFFPLPDKERSWACSLEYINSNFPGKTSNNRSSAIHEISAEKFNFYKNLLYEKFQIPDLNFFKILGFSFQFSCENDYTEIHSDIGWDLAGVVYLSPNAPKNSGTAFYSQMNDKFNKVYEVENIYNRCIIYPANLYHEGLNFFGNTLDDSRLNLVFFAKVNC